MENYNSYSASIINPFGAAVDCSRLAGRAWLATLVDANATALKIFSAARYVNYKYSAPKGLRSITMKYWNIIVSFVRHKSIDKKEKLAKNIFILLQILPSFSKFQWQYQYGVHRKARFHSHSWRWAELSQRSKTQGAQYGRWQKLVQSRTWRQRGIHPQQLYRDETSSVSWGKKNPKTVCRDAIPSLYRVKKWLEHKWQTCYSVFLFLGFRILWSVWLPAVGRNEALDEL